LLLDHGFRSLFVEATLTVKAVLFITSAALPVT